MLIIYANFLRETPEGRAHESANNPIPGRSGASAKVAGGRNRAGEITRAYLPEGSRLPR